MIHNTILYYVPPHNIGSVVHCDIACITGSGKLA